ncbi:MAG TPA: hypothetical protein VMT43_10935, partial [Acidimicrobiales bacterium]|nr:hypothetical protein [Acidimicrobiales bacterium]
RRWPEHMALARDVLDHQLIDVSEVQVVRAADVYLAVRPTGLFLGGVEVSLRAYLRRALWSSRFRFNAPVRLIDWADLQAFATRSVGERTPGVEEDVDPTRYAGVVGGPVRLGVSAHELRTMGPAEIAELLRQLDRNSSSQLVALSESVSAAEALRSLRPDARQALVDALLPADRARLEALLEEEPRS